MARGNCVKPAGNRPVRPVEDSLPPEKAAFRRFQDTYFHDEEACHQYLFDLKHPNGYKCPVCGCEEYWNASRGRHICKHCNHEETATSGTIFAGTRVPLHVWFRVICAFTTSKTGYSAKQCERDSCTSYLTARRMLRKIRKAMEENTMLLEPVQTDLVEIDSFACGGKDHMDEEEAAGTKSAKKRVGRAAGRKTIIEVLLQKENVMVGKGDKKHPAEKDVRLHMRVIPIEDNKSVAEFVTDVLGEEGKKTTVICGDKAFANQNLGKLGYNVNLKLSTECKKTNFIQSVDHIISNFEGQIRGTLHGLPGWVLTGQIEEFVWKFNNRNESPITQAETVLEAMCATRPHKNLWFVEKFRRIKDNKGLPLDYVLELDDCPKVKQYAKRHSSRKKAVPTVA